MFQNVTVNIKVVELKDETQVGGRVKRDVYVADGSGTARVSVWIGAVIKQGDRDDELWVINNVTVAGVPYFDM